LNNIAAEKMEYYEVFLKGYISDCGGSRQQVRGAGNLRIGAMNRKIWENPT
jgi:hypothetical protein